MHSRGFYGGNHKRIQTIMRSGFPSRVHGDIKKAIRRLIAKGLIILVKKDVGAIVLNSKRHKEIKQLIHNDI